jgi:hypothetical protein
MADYYTSHIVPTPKFLPVLQGAIILLSAAVIGLTSYGLSFSDGSDGNSFGNAVVCPSLSSLVFYFVLTAM